ncbi:unnamed protein product [Closterium sp. NIES-64]|nr:unnamed protein product [Closterium sp. NIES-64]
MNPVLKEFTFLSKSAKTSSRIDRALVSASLLPSLSGASHCRLLKGLSDHWFGVKVTFKISLRLCMGPGIWRCKAVEIGRPGAAKAVAKVREKHGKAGSGDFTALMREMNMALRKYSTEERKRVKATLAHLDAAVARLQQEVMRHPSCSVRKEELKVKESQLAAYLASEQERVSLMAGVKELREGELPGKLMSVKKAAKPLKRSVMGDFIKIAVDGSRALKSPQELERAFGGSDGAKLAMRIFDAAPNEWKQMLMAPVTARMVLTVSKFVLKAGTSYGVWRIECVEGETLVCRAIRCFRGVLEEAEERKHNFLPHEVVPAVVREGWLLGPAGGPRARLLCSPIWEGDRPAQLKQLKEGFRQFGGKPKQQSTWEESLGRPIDLGRVIGRLGAIRPGLDDDECRVLGRIMDNSAQPATWSKGFMAIWSDPRAAFRPP